MSVFKVFMEPWDKVQGKGTIDEKGHSCWLDISVSKDEVTIFFDNPVQLAVFCREHNFPLVDNSAKKEEGK